MMVLSFVCCLRSQEALALKMHNIYLEYGSDDDLICTVDIRKNTKAGM